MVKTAVQHTGCSYYWKATFGQAGVVLEKDCVVSVAGSLVVLFNQISGGLAPNIGTTHLAWVITRHQGQLS